MICDECGKRIEVQDRFIPFPEKNFHMECFEETHLLPLLHVATQRLGGGTFPSGRVRLHGDKVIENLTIWESGPKVCPFMSRRISFGGQWGPGEERLVAQPCIGNRCQVWEKNICGVLAAANPVTRLILTPDIEIGPDDVASIVEAMAPTEIPVIVEDPEREIQDTGED